MRNITQVLMEKYIKFSSGQQLKGTVDGFVRCPGFPQCVGAVDSTHIKILAPQECAKDYYNCKGYYSILMQSVADHCFALLILTLVGLDQNTVLMFSKIHKYIKELCSQGTLLPAE